VVRGEAVGAGGDNPAGDGLRVRLRRRLRLHPAVGAVLPAGHHDRPRLLRLQQLLAARQVQRRHLRLWRHRHAHHQGSKLWWLPLQYDVIRSHQEMRGFGCWTGTSESFRLQRYFVLMLLRVFIAVDH
jgi:hypothetical protein